MARRTQTYAIRLAVEGGGQVKAELVSVGQSGEQSLKRIESAGDRASGGLKGLGRQAELLRTGIRTLGGALIGAATVGGLGALIDRSISAADAIGKTADKIGVGVEALQELRFAAKASGVEQQTLDMALQRFTRRAAEAAQGTGEAKDALAQMGIALRDQSGNLRRSEDLLADVADAFARIENPAERMRLAFKLFDSEGVALVNLLRGGSSALEEMRERARDLGIVLDEHLVRDAERARTELDTLSQVISANLTRAALEAAPVIADLSSWLADVAGKAGIAWERLFDAPEEKSLRTLRYELDLASSTIEKLEGRIRELRESPTLGFSMRTRYGPGVSITTDNGAEIEALAGSNPSFAAWEQNEPYTIALLIKGRSGGTGTKHLYRSGTSSIGNHILWLSSGTTPNLRHEASGGGTVSITSSVAIVNDTTWSTIVGTWRPGRLELYVDGWSRASSTAAATNTSALFGIYRWGWGFSTSQDFNGDIALVACFASSWTPAMVRRWHADPFGFLRPWNEVPALMGSAPPSTPRSTGTGVVTFLMG
jgi:Concanavalin A-like lectin/glucanases superfamily